MTALDAASLRELVHYDPETGVFTRLANERPITSKNAGGYIQVWLKPKMYYGHRLAWLYVYGELPPGLIDHINCDRSDNRIANLRIADNTQNLANARIRSDNASGYKGIWFNKLRNTWHAMVECRGEKHYLGTFASPDAAHDAYAAAAKEHFGEYARAA